MTPTYIRKGEWLQVQTPSLTEEVLFRWLAEQFSFPEKIWRKVHAAGGVQWNRQRLSLRLFPTEQSSLEPSWEPLDIVFEDDFVAVVNKPAGVKVHPTMSDESDTLAHRLAGHYLLTGQALAVRVVHRLDQFTSGLIMFAKGEYAQYQLDQAIREHRVKRIYQAIVQGQVGRAQGTIDAPLARDRHRNGYRVSERTGKTAITHFSTVVSGARASLLQLQLETGRTHQIRVHLSHFGHPLLGDSLYGGDTKLISRQALHAQQLVFPHPWSSQAIAVETELPTDLQTLWHTLTS